jgi:hypothetical protein
MILAQEPELQGEPGVRHGDECEQRSNQGSQRKDVVEPVA